MAGVDHGRSLDHPWRNFLCKKKYKEKFGILVEVISDEDAVALQSSDEEISAALDSAIDAAIVKILSQRKVQF